MAARMYMCQDTGEVMTYKEMEDYCRENFDFGDPTNWVTYCAKWWKEYNFVEVSL